MESHRPPMSNQCIATGGVSSDAGSQPESMLTDIGGFATDRHVGEKVDPSCATICARGSGPGRTHTHTHMMINMDWTTIANLTRVTAAWRNIRVGWFDMTRRIIEAFSSAKVILAHMIISAGRLKGTERRFGTRPNDKLRGTSMA